MLAWQLVEWAWESASGTITIDALAQQTKQKKPASDRRLFLYLGFWFQIGAMLAAEAASPVGSRWGFGGGLFRHGERSSLFLDELEQRLLWVGEFGGPFLHQFLFQLLLIHFLVDFIQDGLGWKLIDLAGVGLV